MKTTRDILSRYGRHDLDCKIHGEANLPGDIRCTCGFSDALARKDPLLVRGLEAAEGALVLADLYFGSNGEYNDGLNNDNYCRLVDWIYAAKQELKP